MTVSITSSLSALSSLQCTDIPMASNTPPLCSEAQIASVSGERFSACASQMDHMGCYVITSAIPKGSAISKGRLWGELMSWNSRQRHSPPLSGLRLRMSNSYWHATRLPMPHQLLVESPRR